MKVKYCASHLYVRLIEPCNPIQHLADIERHKFVSLMVVLPNSPRLGRRAWPSGRSLDL